MMADWLRLADNPVDIRHWNEHAYDALRDAVASHTPSKHFIGYASPFGTGPAFPCLHLADGKYELDANHKLQLAWLSSLARALAPRDVIRVVTEINPYTLDTMFVLGGYQAVWKAVWDQCVGPWQLASRRPRHWVDDGSKS